MLKKNECIDLTLSHIYIHGGKSLRRYHPTVVLFIFLRPRPADGKSESAKRRQKMKEEDPQKYQIQLQKARDRNEKNKAEREERWALGTRAAGAEKKAFYANRR